MSEGHTHSREYREKDKLGYGEKVGEGHSLSIEHKGQDVLGKNVGKLGAQHSLPE